MTADILLEKIMSRIFVKLANGQPINNELVAKIIRGALAKGADPNMAVYDGHGFRTPCVEELMRTGMRPSSSIFRAFIKAGADLSRAVYCFRYGIQVDDLAGIYDFSKIDMTRFRDALDENTFVIDELVHYGADINYQNEYGRTLLSTLAPYSLDFNELVKLLNLGADPNKGSCKAYRFSDLYEKEFTIIEAYILLAHDEDFDYDQACVNALLNHGAKITPEFLELLDKTKTDSPRMKEWIKEITKDTSKEVAPVDTKSIRRDHDLLINDRF